MKFVFLTTGLVASMFACNWFFAQEPTPATTRKISGSSSSPALSRYTERTRYEVDYSGGAGTLPALPASQMPIPPAPPAQGNGAFNSSGMIAAWEMENGSWVLKYQPIENAELATAYRQAYQAYQAAADDAAKSKASADLKANLEKRYDLFVEGQSKQVEELEARLAKLKEQLDKRRAAKERVVELKLQMVLSQADGLGFPESGSANQAIVNRQLLSPYSAPTNSYDPKAYPLPSSSQPGLPEPPVSPLSLPPVGGQPTVTAPDLAVPRVEGKDLGRVNESRLREELRGRISEWIALLENNDFVGFLESGSQEADRARITGRLDELSRNNEKPESWLLMYLQLTLIKSPDILWVTLTSNENVEVQVSFDPTVKSPKGVPQIGFLSFIKKDGTWYFNGANGVE
ncbi:MAG: hypothetical protein ACK5SA_01590 [Planctomycetota bacterium]